MLERSDRRAPLSASGYLICVECQLAECAADDACIERWNRHVSEHYLDMY